MATAIYYYSLTGNVKAFAEKRAAETGADLFEIRMAVKYNKLTAFLVGCPYAINQRSSAIIPPEDNFEPYDDIVIMVPIWAGNPAPPVNGIIGCLPPDKTVSLICLSGSGKQSLVKTAALIIRRGCTIKEATCLKTGA